MAEITQEEGPSVVIEAIGLPQTFKQAVDLVSFAGRVVYIGYAKRSVEYETKLFVSKELDIRGSRNALSSEIAAVASMVSEGRVDVEPLISHRYDFLDLGPALEFWNTNTAQVTKIIVNI